MDLVIGVDACIGIMMIKVTRFSYVKTVCGMIILHSHNICTVWGYISVKIMHCYSF